jgi:D-alanyl-D-alanine carboxypeptidase (penicillin-binding protein 5/6)
MRIRLPRRFMVPLVLCGLLAGGPAVAAAAPPPPLGVPAQELSGPNVTADSAVLIDAATGRVLWGHNANVPRHPASTTKMMTALVALERADPARIVEVGRDAAATPGSSARLSPGQRFTLAALLRGLLLRSGNDAAVAIADAVAGSVPAFADLMNAKAAELGLRDTHFENPHGLTSALHRSSAFDLALIARAGLRIPAFAEIVDSAVAEMPGETPDGRTIRRELHTTNRLLLAYDWVDGVKTGTTSAAGSCLVASGTRGGLQLIAVVLHSDDRWGDALRILQWGFAHFSAVVAAVPGATVGSLPVADGPRRDSRVTLRAAGRLWAPLGLDELPWVTLRRSGPAHLTAPVRPGQAAGTLTLLVSGEPLARVPLVAAAAVPRASVWNLLWRRLRPH